MDYLRRHLFSLPALVCMYLSIYIYIYKYTQGFWLRSPLDRSASDLSGRFAIELPTGPVGGDPCLQGFCCALYWTG